MADRNRLKDRARDELFSHINRCGVLEAAREDQEHWLNETIEYLGERYPDLSDADLRELHTLGMRFCQPTISNGGPRRAGVGQVAKREAGGGDAAAPADTQESGEEVGTATASAEGGDAS